jgi:WhiB family transcriptional regulator, redox-sensing transcriptional regulator
VNFEYFFPTLPSLLQAKCRDIENPDIFFPEGKVEEANSLPIARSICGGCIERKECLEYALAENIPFGIWAGTTPKERGVYAQRRRKKFGINNAETIRRLHLQGRTPKEISVALKLDLSYVTQVLRKAGVKSEGELQSQLKTKNSSGGSQL